ncbi:MAG: protein kinase, partial [Oscillospiraceae bacterium]|nr:protein kinase [Oscillospiraceae bacterium]
AILTRLRHTGLPVIHDIFENAHYYFLVMEYIEGDPLNRVIETAGAQPEADVVRWGRQLCGVLQYLHAQPQPIIYRDMKPSNIMLKRDGNVVLIDFGAAREYKNASADDTTYIGTYGYAAPEQYGSGQTDARTDIYCLGVTLYHLATGYDPRLPPYEVWPVREINPNLSKKLELVIQKCTQQNPENRYQSAEELLRELKRIRPKEGMAAGLFRVAGRDAREGNTATVERIPAEIGTEVLPAEQAGLWERETVDIDGELRRKRIMIGLIGLVCLMVVVITGSLLALSSNANRNGPAPERPGESTVPVNTGISSEYPAVTTTAAGTYDMREDMPGADPGGYLIRPNAAMTETKITETTAGTNSAATVAAENTTESLEEMTTPAATAATTAPPVTPLYSPGDIAAINRMIDNNGLDWPKAPSDGSSVPPDWGGVAWHDGSANKRIRELSLWGESLTGSLDLSGLDKLDGLYCNNNDLTALDVSKNTALIILACSDNHLTALDLSKNTSLAWLFCDNNHFKSRDDIIGIDTIENVVFDPQN